VDFGLFFLLLVDVALVVVYFVFVTLYDICKRGNTLPLSPIRIVGASAVPNVWATTSR
jgi:hypothetical protein